jgi:hypothetical protein
VLVLGLELRSRLGAGQDVIDATRPVFTDQRVAGDRAGADFLARYVAFADPLMTARGGAAGEVGTLVGLLARRTKHSRTFAADALRREAPHTDALLRALPLTAVSEEIPRFTARLATTLNISEEALAAQLEQDYPRLSQALTALSTVTSGWNDAPGVDGLTRLDGSTQVRTVPQISAYLGRDLVGTIARDQRDVHDVAGTGGIGYIPTLLLVLGAGLLLFGAVQVRRARDAAPGRLAWGIVVGVGVAMLVLVVAAQYLPRLHAADRIATGLTPVFDATRVQGDRAATDMLHQTVLFGDPIATTRGGAAAEVPQLVALLARSTNVRRADILRSLRRHAPRTTALLESLPLSAVAAEIPHLLTYLGKALHLRRAALIARLQDRTPHLAQSLLSVRGVAIRWNSIPGTEHFTRFDNTTPVRRMPALDDYLANDVVRVLENERARFADFAGASPPLGSLPALLIVLGVLLLAYGLWMYMAVQVKRW